MRTEDETRARLMELRKYRSTIPKNGSTSEHYHRVTMRIAELEWVLRAGAWQAVDTRRAKQAEKERADGSR